jgi:hypothetical protein
MGLRIGIKGRVRIVDWGCRVEVGFKGERERERKRKGEKEKGRDREREREGGRGREREREREREKVRFKGYLIVMRSWCARLD